MVNEKLRVKNPLSVCGVEYPLSTLTERQLVLASHVADLDRKIAAMKFNIEQLQYGREAIHSALHHSLGHQNGN
jgi:hypothetical protein